MATLVRKRLNLAMDLPDKVLDAQTISILKQITGMDMISAEKKYDRNVLSTNLFCKLVFASNHPLKLPSQDTPLARRCVELPFPNSVPLEQQDPDLLNKMIAEREAILFLCIQAYWRLRTNNYVFAGSTLVNPGMVVDGNGIRVEDTILEFIQYNYTTEELTQNRSWVSTDDLFHEYQSYCTAHAYPLLFSSHVFSTRLRAVLAENYPEVTEARHRRAGDQLRGYANLVPKYREAYRIS